MCTDGTRSRMVGQDGNCYRFIPFLQFLEEVDLHCTYTRDQLLVALDFLKPATVREGVKWLSEKQLDVFFVTLNKADKDYSPTTMYHDYSINENLFHWQSQSSKELKSYFH